MVWAEFIMNGGTISDNEALGNYTYGGGVDVQFTDGASFTMNPTPGLRNKVGFYGNTINAEGIR